MIVGRADEEPAKPCSNGWTGGVRSRFDVGVINGVEHRIRRHSVPLAWRAMALLREEIEAEKGSISTAC
jgi:hypothetical protein